jgi:diguanylate cyclase (GGDEF)-like protein/PAS domain S-box-containing protein
MSNRYKYIVDSSQDFITLINKEYVYEVVNPAYEKIIQKPRNEILNRTVSYVWGESIFNNAVKAYIDRCLSGEEVHYIETFKFGLENRYMHVSYYPYRENGSEVSHALVFTHDITKMGKIESKLINYEYRDPLTGLFNRRSLDIILDMELEKARRSKTEKLRAVLFIDIINHRDVNKKFGHEIGNLLLENTGLRIKESLRDSDFTFSYLGSELVVFLSGISDRIDAARVADKLNSKITHPYHHRKYTIKLKSGIGIALFPDDANDKQGLMEKAVSAADEAVRSGKPYLYYDEQLHENSIKRLVMEAELTKAFQNNELELYYQPIVGCAGNILGAEALIRWNHSIKGLVSPIDFIPLAEDTGLIEEIGKWVIFTATRQLASWVKQYDIYVSLNLCAREFGNSELVEIVKNALTNAEDLDPRHLKLEITESEGVRNPESFIERIELLRELGVEIYIDDFGTGQSSLEYLKSIPADVLKIDKIFVDNIHTDNADQAFLSAMVSLVKTREKKIIAEGVGCREQAEIIKSLGCDRMQGYYFSKPLTAADFEALLVEGKTLPLKD